MVVARCGTLSVSGIPLPINMSAGDSWFERNEGFINFAGRLVAIGQRNALIQEQAQTQALLRDGITLEQQRQAAEAQQQNCKDLLYEINQAAKLISDEYSTGPQQAYYEAILLVEKIKEISLDHTWFSDLDWKDYCTKTKVTAADLLEQARRTLSPEQIETVDLQVRREKQLEEQKRESNRYQLRQNRIARKKAEQEADRVLGRRTIIASVGAFVLGVLIFRTISWSAPGWLFAASLLLVFGGFVAAVIGITLIRTGNIKTELRPLQRTERKQIEQTSTSKHAPHGFGSNTFTVDLSTVYEAELDEALSEYPSLLKILRDDGIRRVYETNNRVGAKEFVDILKIKLPGIRVAQSSNIGELNI